MIEDLVKQIETRFAELGQQMTDAEVISGALPVAGIDRGVRKAEQRAGGLNDPVEGNESDSHQQRPVDRRPPTTEHGGLARVTAWIVPDQMAVISPIPRPSDRGLSGI